MENETGKTNKVQTDQTYLNEGKFKSMQANEFNKTQGLGTLSLISQFGGTELSKKQVVYIGPSSVCLFKLLMSLNRRMCDCDKLIDPFCGNTSVLITGNAVQLARIRSLTCSHNNKLTQSCLFFTQPVFLILLLLV